MNRVYTPMEIELMRDLLYQDDMSMTINRKSPVAFDNIRFYAEGLKSLGLLHVEYLGKGRNAPFNVRIADSEGVKSLLSSFHEGNINYGRRV